MTISNYELVNTQFDKYFIAYAFTTTNKNNNKRNNDDDEFSKRLRDLFKSFFCDQLQQQQHQRSNRTKTMNNIEIEEEENDDDGFVVYTAAHHQHQHQHHHQQRRLLSSFKVPALRILISCLELISRTHQQKKKKKKTKSSSSSSINLLDNFWKSMLAYMTECLQEIALHDNEQQPGTGTKTETKTKSNTVGSNIIEAALVVKGIRLLQRIEPNMMRPYIRYSLLPYISNAKEIFVDDRKQSTSTSTCNMGDKILVRECERLLKEATATF